MTETIFTGFQHHVKYIRELH